MSMREDIDLEKGMDVLTDRELAELTARRVVAMERACHNCQTAITSYNASVEGRLQTLEHRDRKDLGVSAGVGGGIVAAIGAAVLWLLKNFDKIP